MLPSFEAQKKTGGKRCPGEGDCQEKGTPNNDRGLRDKSRPIETICSKCDFRFSKPGYTPTYLAPLVATAHRMEALFESGAGSPYPDVFSPVEWDAFLALKYARSKSEERDLPKPPPEANPAVQAALGARVKR